MKCARDECPNLVEKASTGRPGRYCSDACKQKAYRVRQSVTKLNALGVTKQPDILFYCGLNERYWNHHTVESGEYVCIAPFTSAEKEDKITGKKKRVLRKTHVLIDGAKMRHVMIDSCAFSERIEVQGGVIVKNERLSFNDALQRQIAHAYEFRYAHLVESLVSYDLLIDETWLDGERSKARWSVESAEYAVSETIKAAQYLASQRRRIDHAFGHHVRLILSAQGVEAEQYARCAAEIVKVMQPDDIFGLGGWCITGLIRHAMLPAAASILPGVFEVLGRAGVKRVHVFGVILPALLGFLLFLCDLYDIQLSTDSAGPCVEPARNGNWGYGSWTNPAYKVAPVLESCTHKDEQGNKAPTCSPETVCRGLERCRHVALTRDYLAHFRGREPHLVGPLPGAIVRQLERVEVA
jgi:hypothetical protein